MLRVCGQLTEDDPAAKLERLELPEPQEDGHSVVFEGITPASKLALSKPLPLLTRRRCPPC